MRFAHRRNASNENNGGAWEFAGLFTAVLPVVVSMIDHVVCKSGIVACTTNSSANGWRRKHSDASEPLKRSERTRDKSCCAVTAEVHLPAIGHEEKVIVDVVPAGACVPPGPQINMFVSMYDMVCKIGVPGDVPSSVSNPCEAPYCFRAGQGASAESAAETRHKERANGLGRRHTGCLLIPKHTHVGDDKVVVDRIHLCLVRWSPVLDVRDVCRSIPSVHCAVITCAAMRFVSKRRAEKRARTVGNAAKGRGTKCSRRAVTALPALVIDQLQASQGQPVGATGQFEKQC